jgi:hypothetical protein
VGEKNSLILEQKMVEVEQKMIRRRRVQNSCFKAMEEKIFITITKEEN